MEAEKILTQQDIDRIRKEQIVVYINGYYLPEKSEIDDYKCIIGEWDGDDNDNDIFYYFDDLEHLRKMSETENRIDTEFVVTSYIFDSDRKTFDSLWEILGNVPVNEDDEIDIDFLQFKKGTDKFEIWHWFEEKFNITLGDII